MKVRTGLEAVRAISATIALEFEKPVDGKVPSFTLRQAVRATLQRTSEAVAAGEDPPEPGGTWTKAQLQPLTGTYHLAAAGHDWRVAVQGDELTVLLPGNPPHPLHWPDAAGRWKIKVDPNQSLRFVRASDGRVMSAEFQRISEVLLTLAEREHTSMSLAMIDVDHFKRVNDENDHLVGNYVLSELAKVIVKSTRRSDIAGRFGGDEFALCLPRSSKQDSFHVAERIRRSVEAARFPASVTTA